MRIFSFTYGLNNFSLFVYREVRRKCAAAMIVSHARDMETAVQSMLQGAYLGLGLWFILFKSKIPTIKSCTRFTIEIKVFASVG